MWVTYNIYLVQEHIGVLLYLTDNEGIYFHCIFFLWLTDNFEKRFGLFIIANSKVKLGFKNNELIKGHYCISDSSSNSFVSCILY